MLYDSPTIYYVDGVKKYINSGSLIEENFPYAQSYISLHCLGHAGKYRSHSLMYEISTKPRMLLAVSSHWVTNLRPFFNLLKQGSTMLRSPLMTISTAFRTFRLFCIWIISSALRLSMSSRTLLDSILLMSGILLLSTGMVRAQEPDDEPLVSSLDYEVHRPYSDTVIIELTVIDLFPPETPDTKRTAYFQFSQSGQSDTTLPIICSSYHNFSTKDHGIIRAWRLRLPCKFGGGSITLNLLTRNQLSDQVADVWHQGATRVLSYKRKPNINRDLYMKPTAWPLKPLE